MDTKKTPTEETLTRFIREKLASLVSQSSRPADRIPLFDVEFSPRISTEHLKRARTLLERDGDFAIAYSPPETEIVQHGMDTGASFGPEYDWLRW